MSSTPTHAPLPRRTSAPGRARAKAWPRGLRRALLAAVCTTAALAPATPAAASWLTAGSGVGLATTATMPTGATPSVSSSGWNVTVTFAQNAFDGDTLGGRGGGYTLRRYAEGSSTAITPGSACPATFTGTAATFTCTEASVPDGRWQYRVTPYIATFTGDEGPLSAVVVVNGSPNLSAVTARNPAPGASDGPIDLVWTSSAGATGYNVYRRLSGGAFNYATPLNGPTPVTGLAYTDVTATNANTYDYVIRSLSGAPAVESADSNQRSATTITRPAAPPDSVSCTTNYNATVNASGPTSYFRLADTTPAAAVNTVSTTRNGTYLGGVTFGRTGMNACDANTAVSLDGSTGYVGAAGTTAAVAGPNAFTTEIWFKTTIGGGKLIGFGNTRTGASANADRHLYLTNDGRVAFGVAPGAVKTAIVSPGSYKDGQWHMAVATLGAAGMRLYVDGAEVAASAGVTTAQAYTGYWRMGYDTLTGWANAPRTSFFSGTLDEAAVFGSQLSAATIAAHFNARPVAEPCRSDYYANITASGPFSYFRLADTSATTAQDWSAGARNGTYVGGVTFGTPGVVACDTDTAVSFDGSTGQLGAAAATAALAAPDSYTSEVWFKTTVGGGKLLGYGNARTGASTTFDRHLYLTTAGNLVFGVRPGGTIRTVTSPASYTDGQWHMAVATLGAAGMRLYVDGAQVAADATTTTGQAYAGYWRAGFDALTGWPTPPASSFFNGSLDELAIFNRQLSAATIAAHYDGRPQAPAGRPTAVPDSAGQTKVSWSAVNGVAGYNVYRRTETGAYNFAAPLNGATPVAGTTFSDVTSVKDTPYRYVIRSVIIGDANAQVESVNSTQTSTSCVSEYNALATRAAPLSLFRLNDSTAATAVDAMGSTRNGTYVGGVAFGQPGAIRCDADTAVTFNGTTGYMGAATTTAAAAGSNSVTINTWFKTSVPGGRLVGYGDARTGASTTRDRHLYMTNTGQVVFGVRPGGTITTITSPATYADGQWHMATAVLGAAGLRLYIDGVQVAANGAVTTGQAYSGYWRAGYDNLAGWPTAPTSSFFNGSLDEVAIYPTQLSADAIAAQYAANQP